MTARPSGSSSPVTSWADRCAAESLVHFQDSLDYLHSLDHSTRNNRQSAVNALLISDTAPESSIARKLLEEFPPPVIQSSTDLAAPWTVAPPRYRESGGPRWSSLTGSIGMLRRRLMARLAVGRTSPTGFHLEPLHGLHLWTQRARTELRGFPHPVL